MPIALDATSVATPISTGSSMTWSHTCSGSDRLLHVSVGARHSGGTNNVVSGVTYNGVALTLVRGDEANFGTFATSVWRLVAPATGANDIVVTFTGSIDTSGQAVGVSLTGVHQTTPDAGNNGFGDNTTATSVSVSVTTTADNAWIIDSSKIDHPDAPTPNGSQVSISSANHASSGYFSVSRLGPISPAGATSVGWTWTTSVSDAYSAAAYAPAPSTSGAVTSWIRA